MVNDGQKRAPPSGQACRAEIPSPRRSFDRVTTSDRAMDSDAPTRSPWGGGKNKHHRQKKKPRRFPAGAFYQIVRPNLPVALSAEGQGNGVLILQLVGCKRLARRTGRSNGANDTRILLVDTGPGNVSRERQVLDRGPAGDETHRADGEVRVTTRHTGNAAEHATSTTGAADRGLGQGTELGLGVSTVDRGVPVGVPVVGVRTAEAPGLDRFLLAARDEHGVRSIGEADALVGNAGAAKHRVAAAREVLEVVAGRTVGVDALDV